MYNKFRAYTHAGMVIMIVILLLLVAVQSIWVTHGSATSLMNQVGLQRTRSQRLVKDVLILAYRSSVEERAQALNEVQLTLPPFEQTQTGLQAGDDALGLPRRPPPDIQLLLVQAQADYLSLVGATKIILAHAQKVDPAQLQIVLDHERGYTQVMSSLVTLWMQHIDDAFLSLFYLESGVAGILLITVCLMYVMVTRRWLRLLAQQEAQKKRPTAPLTQSPHEASRPEQEGIMPAPVETPR